MTEKTIATNVQSDFLTDTSLWSLTGNEKSVRKLRVTANQYHIDRSENRNPSISPVIFVGIGGSGRSTFAHAYSNALACDNCFQTNGSSLAMGGHDIVEFFQQGTEFSSYLINYADQLSTYCANIISMMVKDRILMVPEIMGRRKASMEPFNKLIMFSVRDLLQVDSEIIRNVDMQIYLNDYSSTEIYKILQQRVKYLGWAVENNDLLQNIAEVSFQTISIAIKTLAWTYRCARASGEEVLTAKHLNQALHLTK